MSSQDHFNMQLKHYNLTLMFGITLCILCGCDTGRVGMHKVVLAHPALIEAPVSVQQFDEERLKRLVNSALSGKGFVEHPGKPHLWQKNGAWIEVYSHLNGDLILKVRAFGSKRDVRVSERTEQELLIYLKQQSDLQLAPVTLPKPPIE